MPGWLHQRLVQRRLAQCFNTLAGGKVVCWRRWPPRLLRHLSPLNLKVLRHLSPPNLKVAATQDKHKVIESQNDTWQHWNGVEESPCNCWAIVVISKRPSLTQICVKTLGPQGVQWPFLLNFSEYSRPSVFMSFPWQNQTNNVKSRVEMQNHKKQDALLGGGTPTYPAHNVQERSSTVSWPKENKMYVQPPVEIRATC